MELPYCKLERFGSPDYWRTYAEVLSDWSQVEARLDRIWNDHGDLRDVGVSVLLFNRFDGMLHVGISKKAWLLIMRNRDQPTRMIRGQCPDIGRTAFLLPERTEFEGEELLSEATAKHYLRRWLEKGGDSQL